MRRRPGIGGIKNAEAAKHQYRALGESVAKSREEATKTQFETFREKLREFSSKYKHAIRSDPSFRAHFHSMCLSCGVDPLASNKGVWAEVLGIGDFYYELSVRIIEICLSTRKDNGGIIDLSVLCQTMNEKTSKQRHKPNSNHASSPSLSSSSLSPSFITEDDCLRAIEKIKVLGGGFELFVLAEPGGREGVRVKAREGERFGLNKGKGRRFLRCVPKALSKDQGTLLELAEKSFPVPGCLSLAQVQNELKWEKGRARDALQIMMQDGIAMLDDGHEDGEKRYWLPCIAFSTSDNQLEVFMK